jgi:hypothetical protein
MDFEKYTNSDFHEKIKEIRNEYNLAINVNSNHGYGINVK